MTAILERNVEQAQSDYPACPPLPEKELSNAREIERRFNRRQRLWAATAVIGGLLMGATHMGADANTELKRDIAYHHQDVISRPTTIQEFVTPERLRQAHPVADRGAKAQKTACTVIYPGTGEPDGEGKAAYIDALKIISNNQKLFYAQYGAKEYSIAGLTQQANEKLKPACKSLTVIATSGGGLVAEASLNPTGIPVTAFFGASLTRNYFVDGRDGNALKWLQDLGNPEYPPIARVGLNVWDKCRSPLGFVSCVGAQWSDVSEGAPTQLSSKQLGVLGYLSEHPVQPNRTMYGSDTVVMLFGSSPASLDTVVDTDISNPAWKEHFIQMGVPADQIKIANLSLGHAETYQDLRSPTSLDWFKYQADPSMCNPNITLDRNSTSPGPTVFDCAA